ncbi:glucose-1-phosphate adenylyltransferase [Halofilum ochraceum]|uniref:glucose-1-phosphate adenylyltransferase n=1 Tax=Halofilum ochraceum TaxID=1611323 RepID=UPI0008D9334A|nr:glucose-1-phosphate adenylyltransferase [Halofilum ochraceum]
MWPRKPERFVSRITRETLALVLAGGRGTRLGGLTTDRVKPAVPFGGKFRIIDFALSNCVNSGIRQIGVLTQYMAHELIQHVQHGWGFFRGEFGEFVELLPAQQRVGEIWYRGTADAVYQNADIVEMHDPEYVLVLGGDHVYKMDYGTMLGFHVEHEADVTVGCMPVPREQATGFGVLDVDDNGRVNGFVEKPVDPPPMPGQPDMALASMGIYIFRTEWLLERLREDALDETSAHDFGRDILPAAVAAGCEVYGFPFRDPAEDKPGYWRDVGDIDSYWSANLELIGVTPELNLYDQEWPIWTYQEQWPPAKFVFDEDGRRGMAIDSMLSGGCIVAGASVRHSLLFTNVWVDEHSTVDDALALPNVRIGRNCRIRRAIIDANCRIEDGTVIGEDPVADAERFHVSRGGVVLVTREHLGQDRRRRRPRHA